MTLKKAQLLDIDDLVSFGNNRRGFICEIKRVKDVYENKKELLKWKNIYRNLYPLSWNKNQKIYFTIDSGKKTALVELNYKKLENLK